MKNEEIKLFLDSEGDLCRTGGGNNLIACPAIENAENGWAILNPGIFEEIVKRFNEYPGLLACHHERRKENKMKNLELVVNLASNGDIDLISCCYRHEDIWHIHICGVHAQTSGNRKQLAAKWLEKASAKIAGIEWVHPSIARLTAERDAETN